MTPPPAPRARRLASAALASLCTALLGLSAGPALASEHIVEIAWRADGRFDHSATIAPGKMLEVCGKLAKDAAVQWQFEASQALSFNIHYHLGKEVVYPAKLPKADKAKDVLHVARDEDHCWMWVNKSTEPATLKLGLSR